MARVNNRRHHPRRCRSRHSHKILVPAGLHSLHVKPRQPPRRADQKRQAADPRELSHLVKLTVPRKRIAESPSVSQNRRRNSETHHVRQRIKLHSKLRIGSRHPRDASVHRIKQNGQPDGLRRMVEIFFPPDQSGNRSVVATKQVRHREQAGNQKNSAAQPCAPGGLLHKRHLVLFSFAHVPSRVTQHSTTRRASIPQLFCALTGIRAITLDPPFTLSPTFTANSAPSGSHRSTRDPNRTNPTNSPRPTKSPVFFHDTTRRATHPAICLKTISPYSLERVKTFCSFSSDAFSAHAARNFPGLYSSCVIVPAAGERFTCTFQIARKILIRFPGRPAFSSSCTTTTRPSAGDTTTPSSIGIFRSGLRKK